MIKDYKVNITNFHGPMDLLLHLIEKNKLNIYEINIVEITEQYIDFIKLNDDINLEITSEFIYMASTLIYLKTKALLPDENIDNSSDEKMTKKHLEEKLILYKMFKNLTFHLKERESEFDNKYFKSQEDLNLFLKDDLNEEDLNIDNFKEALYRLLDKNNTKNENISKVKKRVMYRSENYSINDKKEEILKLKKDNKLNYLNLFNDRNNSEIIVIFLGILELIKQNLLNLRDIEFMVKN